MGPQSPQFEPWKVAGQKLGSVRENTPSIRGHEHIGRRLGIRPAHSGGAKSIRGEFAQAVEGNGRGWFRGSHDSGGLRDAVDDVGQALPAHRLQCDGYGCFAQGPHGCRTG